MNDFLQDYREMNRYLYLENYQIKNNQQLIFLKLPPVSIRYPNQDRIFCNVDSYQQIKKDRKRFSFRLEIPDKEYNLFRVFGHSPVFHDDPDYIKDIGEEKTVTVHWADYLGKSSKEELEGEFEGEFDSDDESAIGLLKKKTIEKRKLSMIGNKKTERKIDYQNTREIEEKTLIIQKYILRIKSQQVFRNLKKRKFKRMNVCKELVKTEKDYVNNLKVLRSVYIEPFKILSQVKGKPIISPQDFGQIFAGLESIIKLNEGLALCLEKCIFDKNGDYHPFALLSKDILSIAPFIMMYRTYCAKYERTLSRLKFLRKDSRFNQVLDKMDRDAKTTKLGLPSYLILPIQRVPRYKLLLRDIIRCTEDEHPDKSGLDEAYTKIEETADLLNQAMKEIEESEKVLRLSKRFLNHKNFVIHQPHRRFVREGTLYKEKNKKFPRHIHLFNDCLVISIRNQRGMFEFENVLEMKNISLNYTNDLGYQKCINFTQKNILFHCRSVEDRDKWLKAIYKCKQEYVKYRSTNEASSNPSNTSNIGFSSKFKSIQYTSTEEFRLTKDQCIRICKDTKNPTIMLKYKSKQSIFMKNKPHQRKFVVSKNEKKVMWGSPNKKLSESGIDILSIKELVVGQTTITFKKNPIASLAGMSFSLLYGDGNFDKNGDWNGKTLDLIALKREDFEIWLSALKFLIQDKGRTTYLRNESQEKATEENTISVKRSDNSIENSLVLNANVEKEKFEKSYSNMGDIYTWGRGDNGALGHGTEKSEKQPKVVMILLPYDVKKVFCGKRCSSAVLTNGNVLTWGNNEKCKLGHTQENANFLSPQPVINLGEKKIKFVSHGDFVTFFLGEDGSVWGCGDNSQLFLSTSQKLSTISSPVLIFSENLGYQKIEYVEAGSNHFGVIDVLGRVYTWGEGSFGQLGHGIKENEKAPRIVESLKDKKIVQIALGNWHSLVLTEEGEVFSFGDGSFGQLGRKPNSNEKMESSVPEKVVIGNNETLKIIQISTGQSHSGAIDEAGNCYLWGAGNYGQLGNGNTRKVNYTPVLVKHYISSSKSIVKCSDCKFLQLSCGANHCIALTLNKQTNKKMVFTWGAGTYGRLGFKSEKDVYIPTELKFFENKIVREVQAKGQISSTVNSHQWIPDSDAPFCMKCDKPFTFRRRRHHCRNCGGIFCSKDSSKKIMILHFGVDDDVRVCDNCYALLKSKYKI